MDVFIRVVVMGKEIHSAEHMLSFNNDSWCVELPNLLEDLRFKYGNWATIHLTLPPVE